MIRSILVLPLLAAACVGTSGASEPEGPSCAPGDLACAVLQVEDVEALFGDAVRFEPGELTETLEGADWCGIETPTPTVNHSLSLNGTMLADNSQFTLVTNVLKFPAGEAVEFFETVSGLPKGCDWVEGDVLFQYIDSEPPRFFADQSAGALFRVSTGPESLIVQVFWIREGDIVLSIAFAPSISASNLIDALLDTANKKLQSVSA